MASVPQLMEPNTSALLHYTLKQCNQFKKSYYTNLYSALFLLLFLGGGSLLLYCRWKGKPTPQELERQKLKQKQVMLEQIKEFQLSKLRAQQVLITGLPHWKNEYDDVAWLQRIMQS